MEPEVLQLIPKNESYGMDDVIRKVLVKRKKVSSVVSTKGFLDIGDKDTYEKANDEYRKKLGKIWMSELIIRKIIESDLENGFLESLDSLRQTSNLEQNSARNILKQILGNENHIIHVAELDGKIVGSTTLLVEQKFIHEGGIVGHIEDVVVKKEFEGQGIGMKLVLSLLDIAKKRECYKTILNCEDELIPFYEKIGFKQKSNDMRFDH